MRRIKRPDQEDHPFIVINPLKEFLDRLVQYDPLIIKKFEKFPDKNDLKLLYLFYIEVSNWQQTNQIYATNKYTSTKLGIGVEKIQRLKRILIMLGLIENYHPTKGKWYIRLKFLYGKNFDILTEVDVVGVDRVSTSPTNMLRSNRRDTYSSDFDPPSMDLNTDSSSVSPLGKVTPSMFEKFWRIYPRKDLKGKSEISWNRVCKLPKEKRPTWKQIKLSIIKQKESERWKESIKFIPLAPTWLNQHRWQDDPSEMVSYKRKDEDENERRIKKTKKVVDGVTFWKDENDEWVMDYTPDL